MKRHGYSVPVVIGVQMLVLGAFAVGYAALSDRQEVRLHDVLARRTTYPVVAVPRSEPLIVSPLYDDPAVVSDAELAAVLAKVQPRFPIEQRKPNYVEHALRAWGESARFRDPDVMSGVELRDFLLDHSRYAASWQSGDDHHVAPILVERPQGVEIRWGSEPELSVHHDHLLACLAEAGITLEQRVFTPSGRHHNLRDVLQQALRDFNPDERETEWSALAFALWLPPVRTWQTEDGREVSFDMLAKRLMRGQKEIGVCSGTHRVYSLMALWRIDQEHDILSDTVAADVWQHLETVRDLIVASQFPDGRWPTNWADGRAAVENPRPGELEYRQVIATGHHLEWLAIAPLELHPPREQIRKAADWLIANTTGQTADEIMQKFTFYSHVGNALALWRNTHPADFWKDWQTRHPDGPPPANAEKPDRMD